MKTHKPRSLNARLFALLSLAIAVIVGIVVVVAIFFRPGGFSVVAQGQGTSLEFKFSDSRVDLGDILDQLLKQADGAADHATKRRLIALTLQAHGFYSVPSIEAVRTLREIEETDSTREFVRAVRTMLYDLAGPFSRPATFLDAPDDRILLAIDDLFERKPSSPLVAKLWEMSLEMRALSPSGTFKLPFERTRVCAAGLPRPVPEAYCSAKSACCGQTRKSNRLKFASTRRGRARRPHPKACSRARKLSSGYRRAT